jgi:hypothetical protein
MQITACQNCCSELSEHDVLGHASFSWPEMNAFWFVCPDCGVGSHMRVEQNELSRIRMLGAPGPDWEVVKTWRVPGLSFRVDPGFLHIWLGQQRFELPARGA